VTWLSATPALAVALALLFAPGGLVVLAAGVRTVVGVALAPVISVAIVSLSAVVAQLGGVRWGPPVVVASTGLAVVAVAGVRLVLRRYPPRSPNTEPDGWRALTAGVSGAAFGATAIVVGLAAGVGSADRWPQTFDAVFHLSAIDHVMRTGDGSSLTLGTLVAPDSARSFYPGAWHDLAALVAMATGSSAPLAANAVALVSAAVAWPLGCVALTRVAVGPVPATLAAAGALASGLTASPVLLTGYGTLWPNALATALLPACLALWADLFGLGPHRATARPIGWLLLALALAGLGLAHPNAGVALLVVGSGALVVGWWDRGLRRRLGSLAMALAVGWLVSLSPAFASQRAQSWPAREGLAQAAGEWLALAPQRVPLAVLLAGLTLVGCGVAALRPDLRWLLAVHLTAGALFVLVAGSDGRLSRRVSAAWWDDPNRLAALVGVAGVPLAAIGLDALVRHALARWRAGPRTASRQGSGGGSASGRPARWALPASVVVVGLALVVGWQTADTERVVGWAYRSESMLTPQESAFVAGLRGVVPAGERVAGNPWDGAALTGPLADREAAFPHLVGHWGADRQVLATSLASASTAPAVCGALARLRIRYVLVGPTTFWSGDPRRFLYAGLEVAGRPGFVEVGHAGRVSLWRVPSCTASA